MISDEEILVRLGDICTGDAMIEECARMAKVKPRLVATGPDDVNFWTDLATRALALRGYVIVYHEAAARRWAVARWAYRFALAASVAAHFAR